MRQALKVAEEKFPVEFRAYLPSFRALAREHDSARSGPLDLYNAGYREEESGNFAAAIDLYNQALAASPSAGSVMIVKFQMAGAIWQWAGLERDGKVESLNAGNVGAAEAARLLWQDVVNTYHREVESHPDELRRWPGGRMSPKELSKAAVGASHRAAAALSRVQSTFGVCTSCNHQIAAGDAFCGNCGMRL
jgi:tetratricopeptide (TPR) repeat protein